MKRNKPLCKINGSQIQIHKCPISLQRVILTLDYTRDFSDKLMIVYC